MVNLKLFGHSSAILYTVGHIDKFHRSQPYKLVQYEQIKRSLTSEVSCQRSQAL